MANPQLFGSQPKTAPTVTVGAPAADTVNPAGGVAFAYTPKHQLAQLLMTGTGFDSFYQGGESQLTALVQAVQTINDPMYLAKAIVAGATKGFMKDLPLAALVLLSKQDKGGDLFRAAFKKVVWDGRRLRTFFQMITSKQLGRSSLSYRLKTAFCRWLNEASPSKLINASIGGKGQDGKDASLEDVLALARPKPQNPSRRAMYAWLRGRAPAQWTNPKKPELGSNLNDLPPEAVLVRAYDRASTEDEQISLLRSMQVQRFYIRWDRLSGNAKGPAVWKEFARSMAPQALRMNLNSLSEHGVFDDDEVTQEVIRKLTDAEEIKAGRQFPYQYYGAYKHLGDKVPAAVRAALHRAAELCCGNVARFPGPVAICIDVSSSMSSPVTGTQAVSKTSKITCVDAAAVTAAALFRANPDSVVIPFNTSALTTRVDPSDSMLSLASQLAALCSGGTDCHTAMQAVNARYGNRPFAAVVYLSDNASWVTPSAMSMPAPMFPGMRPTGTPYATTPLMAEWMRFCENQKRIGKFPRPKMVCWDFANFGSTQAPESVGIYNIGGFSDAMFGLISAIVDDDQARFVRMVEETPVL